MLGYYYYGCIFIVLVAIYIHYDKPVLAKGIVEIWKHVDLDTIQRSDDQQCFKLTDRLFNPLKIGKM